MSMEQLYRQTIEKTQTLECYGYRVIELWECEYDKKYKEDSEFLTNGGHRIYSFGPSQTKRCIVW